jgi:glutamate 5-kinase
MDERIRSARRWVIKIGSALLTNDGAGLNLEGMAQWAEQIATLQEQGKEVVVISSGAVAAGMSQLGWNKRPQAIPELQAAAAVGQMQLIKTYEKFFQSHGLHSAQILLTHEDLTDRKRYLNARSTLKTLLSHKAIPVVNENDTVATIEIRFGDNDTLAALVANLIEADVLLILTDQQGLFDKNPQLHDDATLIAEADANNPQLLEYAGEAASELSRGGMTTKILAAQKAARSGTHTIIANGRETQPILRIANGEHLGTRLRASKPPVTARKQWIANQLKQKGKLHLDAGAAQALRQDGRSLLPVGISRVEGNFQRGDLVSCIAPDGSRVALGLVNYNVDEARKIAGKGSGQVKEVLGYINEVEMIHRDNLSLV